MLLIPMNVHIGPKIRLPTRHGNFDVVHVLVTGASGIIREGVALQRFSDRSPILVRVQSSCLFSESFWASDCDCALQLHASLARISQEGGILLYFYEEGRGAGLTAKFKAIELQQVQGLDTRQAYECLSMSVDARSYEAAAAALLQIVGNAPICLLSNNLDKEEGLKTNGVRVIGRERLIVGWDQPAVRKYLEEKRAILHHDIPQGDLK
jgi:GTP cyclohydrolase II